MNAVFDRLQRLLVLAASRTDLVLAVMIVAIVFMMILPLPLAGGHADRAEHLMAASCC
jgi:hypothetical protein